LNDLLVEFKKMKKRYEKLVSDGKKLETEYSQNVEYFIDNHVSDPEWKDNLESVACNLASASLTMKIVQKKMEQIKIKLERMK